jgi:hypothetical protein
MNENPLKLVTGTHRASYLHVDTPAVFDGEDMGKYSVTLLIKKDHPDVAKIKGLIRKAYDANKESMFKGIPLNSKNLHNPLRDGDDWLEEHPGATEYEGCYFVKASTTRQPKVFGRDKQEILDLEEVYSGCYCRAVIVCFPFNTKAKGFSFYLNSLMKMEDGERLGGFEANPDEYGDEDDDLI